MERRVWLQGIETVLFDFDGTLVHHEPDSFDLVRAFCADIGQPLSAEAERRGRRERHRFFVEPAILRELQEGSRDQFWLRFNRYLLQAIGIEGDLDQLAGALSARFVGLEWRHFCRPEDRRTLTELRRRDYRLGLITNRDHVAGFAEILQRVDLASCFDLILASGEVGVRKPEPGIFDTALERLGASAERAIYVGDNYWADVLGAQWANITPVLLDPQRLFPEAECLVLERLPKLLDWLPEQGGLQRM